MGRQINNEVIIDPGNSLAQNIWLPLVLSFDIKSIYWLLRRTNFRNIQIIYKIRQAPPDCLFNKSTVAEMQEVNWKRIDRCKRVGEKAKKL